MPTMTVERVKEREARIAKQIADKGDSIEQAELRSLKKKLRRAQRKRRKLMVAFQKAEEAKGKKKAEAKAEAPAAEEAPAEDAPAESKDDAEEKKDE